MSILKISNLSHRYSLTWAIRDINLEINQTGIIGLLGSNGAGKSTTMNIICGALKQSEGRVEINGIDLQKEPERAKREIGFLPQILPLYTDLTVDEYLHYCAELRLMKPSVIHAAVEEVKEKCQISHFSNRLIKNLSGGYRQRVGIAQSIIHKPQLVIMDEPTNGLDPNQLIEVRKLIQEIGKERTVLLSSHVMSEIHLLCREIIMIEAGRVVFSDTIDAFNNYLRPNSLLVYLENPPAEAELREIKGITGVEYMSERKLRIFFDNGQNVEERIVERSVHNGWRLKEISLEKGVLEDVFKQLSTQILQN
ncbi:multidrug ABC transporter ATP-binding protein [Pedobacter sp. HMWF019]|uniref:ABC transporter ATP-binding protein n=1 Tax=Pedobacter sp. HMWF019 TaxID=2056856 RepID=UPI000D3AF471|nr:ATP-binding cassette domain-containing protein [Pedobacter sp. HMWF019]PTS97078.1 multidrug ABC transporter ATP-binding protein [Pedobacter sp. HMWF019]